MLESATQRQRLTPKACYAPGPKSVGSMQWARRARCAWWRSSRPGRPPTITACGGILRPTTTSSTPPGTSTSRGAREGQVRPPVLRRHAGPVRQLPRHLRRHNDLAAGHIQVGVVDIGSDIAQNTKMWPVAISAAGRYAALPEVQTLVGSLPGSDRHARNHHRHQAPAGTPAPVVTRLDTASRAGLGTPELKARLAFLHLSPLPLPPDEGAKRIRTDNPRWDALIRKAGIEQE